MKRKIDSVEDLVNDIELSGELEQDVISLFAHYGVTHLTGHSFSVANQARDIAERIGIDPHLAAQAGLLHDIGGVIPTQQRVAAARAWSIPLLPQEETFPLIIHQKLSVVIAREIFQIEEEIVLDAIGCHTTLRAYPTALDMVLFIADKIKWDQSGKPPYLDTVVQALEVSIEQGVYTYLEYVWFRRKQLAVIHPWLQEAYEYFAALNR